MSLSWPHSREKPSNNWTISEDSGALPVSCPEFQVYRNGERIDNDSVALDLLFDDEVYPGFGYYKNSSPYLGDLLREAFMPELDTIVRDARFGTHSSAVTNSGP